MTMSRFAAALLITVSAYSLPALAQTDPQERVDRLEHDLQLLQKQVANGAPVDSGAPITNTNQLEVRLSGIEDQMRELRGLVEQTQNQVRQVTENLNKFQQDTEFRFQQQPQAAAHTPAPAPVATPTAANPPQQVSDTSNLAVPDELKNQNLDPTRNDPTKKKVAPGALKSNFATPRDHYNYAFRLLNQTQYEQAAASFDEFTQKFPKDALVGNAYYWEGETYYIRRDYVKSADLFRQGYESMPEGPKAADNLYKLALSLNALDRTKEGCVVLQEVVSKFKKTSTNVANKAEQELKSTSCRKNG